MIAYSKPNIIIDIIHLTINIHDQWYYLNYYVSTTNTNNKNICIIYVKYTYTGVLEMSFTR